MGSCRYADPRLRAPVSHGWSVLMRRGGERLAHGSAASAVDHAVATALAVPGPSQRISRRRSDRCASAGALHRHPRPPPNTEGAPLSPSLNRREALKAALAGGAVLLGGARVLGEASTDEALAAGACTLAASQEE